jgi:putative Holliday junction resolvase
MRYLGIDYGTKRVGVAVSDEAGTMAFPRSVLPNDGALLDALVALIEKEAVGAVVIGHSVNTKGEANAVQDGIENLILDLTLAVGLPVESEPEQYTTQAALRIQGRTSQTDASAAALILTGYLDRQRHRRR